VLFRLDPLKAMEKSVSTTRGQFMPILVLMLTTYLPILITVVAFELILSVINNPLVGIIAITAWSFIAQFVNVVLFRTFMEVMKEQSGTVSDTSA
jgi:hypothetical protein